jgi:large subunit ribosomal protein L7/L12
MSEDKTLSSNAQKVLDTVEKLSVLELAELVKAMEEKFGVSAAAPVAVAPAGGGGQAEEVKDTFDVILTGAGSSKIQVIKTVREITGLGLKEAKELVDSAPKPIKEGIKQKEADEIAEKIKGAGASVEIK